MIRLKYRRSRPRSTDASDDRGSMPMALLVTLVGTLLGAVLLPVVVNQIVSTRILAARTHALSIALAGIDAALGQLRAATPTDNPAVGERAELPPGAPCEMSGSEGLGALQYDVQIVYHPDDADDICLPDSVPVTATLTSIGKVPLDVNRAVTRTIEATYTFKTDSVVSITGGALQMISSRAHPLCLDGRDDAAGAQVMARQCVAGGSSDQRFAYTADLNIKLVGSEIGAPPAGLCLEAPRPPHDSVTFQPCLGRTEPRQQWRLAGRSFYGTDAGTLNRYCLSVHDAGALGDKIAVDDCTSAQLQRWHPSADFTGPRALTNIKEIWRGHGR